MSKYTQGICGDGAEILKDEKMLTIEKILRELNSNQVKALKTENLKLRALVNAIATDLL